MRLIEIARGHVVLKCGEKTVTIYGEALLRGYGSPDFVVYSNTIENWDLPHDKEKIPKEIKMKILGFLRDEFLKRKMTVEIE